LKKKKIKLKFFSSFLIKNCNLLIPRPHKRTSKQQEKPSALKREHPALKKINLLTFFYCIFLLDPDPQHWIPGSQKYPRATKKENDYNVMF
jgi:hypothetical protein